MVRLKRKTRNCKIKKKLVFFFFFIGSFDILLFESFIAIGTQRKKKNDFNLLVFFFFVTRFTILIVCSISLLFIIVEYSSLDYLINLIKHHRYVRGCPDGGRGQNKCPILGKTQRKSKNDLLDALKRSKMVSDATLEYRENREYLGKNNTDRNKCLLQSIIIFFLDSIVARDHYVLTECDGNCSRYLSMTYFWLRIFI